MKTQSPGVQSPEYDVQTATFTIHSATPADKAAWQRMRERLWPDAVNVHGAEIDRYFGGGLHEPLEVLIAIYRSARDGHRISLPLEY